MSQVLIDSHRTFPRWLEIFLGTSLCIFFAAFLLGPIALWSFVRGEIANLPEATFLKGHCQTSSQTSQFFGHDGTLLLEQPFEEDGVVGHRICISQDEFPRHLVAAILAAEDVRFLEHPGVDVRAIARATRTNLKADGVKEGASTITQQLVRALWPTKIGSKRKLRRKLREAALAYRVEKINSKRDIFNAYANHVFLGAGAHGVGAAAKLFFSKKVGQLTPSESALIAGQIQAPSRTNPFHSPNDALARRNQVLDRMQRAGWISNSENLREKETELELNPPEKRYGMVSPWETEWVRQMTQTALPHEFKEGGLHVFASHRPALSYLMQSELEDTLKKLEPKRTLQGIAFAWDHQTGYVEGSIGGRDWQTSKFDRVRQSCRQPGSAFKPLLFGAALEKDVITPATVLRDMPISTFEEKWSTHWKPSNEGREFRGAALAHDALVWSLNAASVDVLDRIGFESAVAFAKGLGIESHLEPVRPLALGASCVSPLELANAYGIFADKGREVPLKTIIRIEKNGERLIEDRDWRDATLTSQVRLEQFRFAERRRVLSPETAYLLTQMMRDVTRRGTGKRARGRLDIAGKTGTTNNNGDAWFMGFTPRVVVASWFGFDQPTEKLQNVHDGGRATAPFWKRIVALVEGERERIALYDEVPEGVVSVRVDPDTGYLSSRGRVVWVKKGTEPTESVETRLGRPGQFAQETNEF